METGRGEVLIECVMYCVIQTYEERESNKHTNKARGYKLGHEADHSPPSRAEVNSAWSYTSTPLIRLHGVVLS